MKVTHVTGNSLTLFRSKDIDATNPHYAETANVTRHSPCRGLTRGTGPAS